MVNLSRRKKTLRMVAALAIGGSIFQLGACDADVRSTLLSGLQTTTEALADTLIEVFFTSLADEDKAGSGLTTI